MKSNLTQHNFLFEQLIKRDFTKKYKRTILGIVWSILSPLMNLLIMWLVFENLLGTSIDHYLIYLFAGQLVFTFFTDSTNLGMNSLVGNASIFTKINVPKYLFIFSQNVSSLINFLITLVIFFCFVMIDGIPLTFNFIVLLFPIVCLVLFNLGVSLILSALFVFFKDVQYLWGIATQLIMWLSAIFYTTESFSFQMQTYYHLNPLYVYIAYFREVVLQGTIPSIELHVLSVLYAVGATNIGFYMYKRYNHDFLFYV